MILGYFDYVIIAIVIFLSIKYWNNEFNWKKGCFLNFLLFGVVIPFLSINIGVLFEIFNESDSNDLILDNGYLIFLFYWILGILFSIVIGRNNKRKRKKPAGNNV